MEKHEVILETTAVSDLNGILDYISDVLKEPQAAQRIFLAIVERTLSLDELPHRQGIVKDEPYKSLGVRWLPIENYTAFYVIDEDRREVRVLRILYNRRNWQAIL